MLVCRLPCGESRTSQTSSPAADSAFMVRFTVSRESSQSPAMRVWDGQQTPSSSALSASLIRTSLAMGDLHFWSKAQAMARIDMLPTDPISVRAHFSECKADRAEPFPEKWDKSAAGRLLRGPSPQWRGLPACVYCRE
jgi:hypothetical protein